MILSSLFTGRSQNLFLQLHGNKEVGFGAVVIHFGFDGGNLAGVLGPKQDSQNTCDGETGPRCQLASLLFVNEDEVRAHPGHDLHQRRGLFADGGLFVPAPTTFLGTYLFYEGGNLLVILLMFLWDWKRDRMMKQFVWAALLVIGVGLTATGLYFNGTWQAISRGWLESWAQHML